MVRWAGALSDEYTLDCGVRQGGLTSPLLFNLYVNELIVRLSSTHVGCYIGETCFNNISYADDMVLLGPTIGSIRKLVKICEGYAEAHGLQYNSKKSELLIFKAGKHQPKHMPPLCLNGTELKVVDTFRYLGHIVTQALSDNEDIERERRALTVRSNMLAHSKKALNALRVQYNNAFRMLLGLPRGCSASGMFTEARTDGFHAIIRKKMASLLQRLRSSSNSILGAIKDRIGCPIIKHWVAVATGRLELPR
nr:uncharacterized protein LOC117983197 [Maniola hyperantus]